MIHIISDSDMHYIEKDPEQHIINPNCNYIIIAGNISTQNKRTMLYGETLAKMYPNSKIIFNYGILESFEGIFNSIKNGFNLRINDFKQCPKNLFYPQGKIVGEYDVYCTIGWPALIKLINFEDAFICKSLFIGLDEEFYIDDILVTDTAPRKFTPEHIDYIRIQEELQIKKWLELDQGKPKMLVTSLSDWSDKFIGDSEYTIFPNLDLSDVIWVCGGDKEFVGSYRNSHVISLPGRDRTRCISEETMNLVEETVLE